MDVRLCIYSCGLVGQMLGFPFVTVEVEVW